MYSSTSSSNPSRGVEICVEALHEWKIEEIELDGTEKHVKPLEFSELITQNARAINWKAHAGKESSLDLTISRFRDQQKSEKNAVEVEDTPIPSVEPTAGPWANVAKNLHAAIQETFVMHDVLITLKSSYLNYYPTVLELLPTNDAKMKPAIEASKLFHFFARKRAIAEGLKIFANTREKRENSNCLVNSKNDQFFTELKKMRENWRIRKINNSILGDISYTLYSTKFNAKDIFDVFRRNTICLTQDSNISKSANIDDELTKLGSIYVRLPQNLIIKTKIWVSIVNDNDQEGLNLFSNRDHLNIDENTSKNVHWEKALEWGQETLISNDIFTQLIKDCVNLERICMPGDDCISILLFDNFVLKIERKYYSFTDSEIPEEGNPFLTTTLHELFLLDKSKKNARSQQFISLPATVLPENLDLRGPQSLSVEEIKARLVKKTSLLDCLINISSHYVLVKMVMEAVKEHTIKYSDPQVQLKFVRASNLFTIMSIAFINRSFETIGKFSAQIRIFADKIDIVTKEAQQIHCRRDIQMFNDALLLLKANFFLNSVAILSKAYAWQVLHANNNAFNFEGNPAPTFYSCNQNATKILFIQFSANGKTPSIFIKQNLEPNEPLRSDGPGKFIKLNYLRLPGSSFMRKMDYVFAIFKS